MSRGREPWWRVPVTSRKEVAGTRAPQTRLSPAARLGALSPKRTAPRALLLGDGGYAQTYAAGSIGGPAFMSRQVSRPNPAGPWFSPPARLARWSLCSSSRPTAPKTCKSPKQGRVSLRLASLRALLRAHTREDADVIGRPELPRFGQERGRRDVGPLVVVADDADDLQIRESRAASASDWASLRALLRQLSREEGMRPP